jgi:C1A family cysteine protease
MVACAGFVPGTGQTTLQAEADAVSAAIAAAGAQWTAGITSIARLSAAERLLRSGTILRSPTPEERMSVPVGLTPPAFDWRQKDGADWTSPIRDQGACGSCWDFSAIGVFEALLNIGAANPAYDVNLSEQYILSCCPDCGSCQGGWPSMALEFCRTTGAVTEACLPYSANDTVPCGSACVETPQQIGAWGYLSADVSQIKQAIYSYGPVSACFEVYGDFAYYTSGVYEHVYGGYEAGHAIVIVGWNDASQAWICKNSWGTDWGETIAGQPYTPGAGNGGWFRIRWGNCNIESYETTVATLTTFPTETVVVTVLDQNGLGVQDVEVWVECGSQYDPTP